MEKKSLLKLRTRIYIEFGLYFHYSIRRNRLFGTFAVVPVGLREFIESLGFSYFRFADGDTYVELNDHVL